MKREQLLSAITAFAIAWLLSACSLPQPDPKADAAARLAYAQMHDGQFDALLAHSTSEMNTPDVKPKLAQTRALLPPGQARSIKAVTWTVLHVSGGEDTFSLAEEYDYGDRIVLEQTWLVRPNAAAPWRVRGMHAQVATSAELNATKFTLAGKTPTQYGFLVATGLSPLLMLAALVKVVRTKRLKLKWLWGIFAFIGLTSFHMNWMTGGIEVQWVSLQFIGAGIVKTGSQFGIWMLTFTLPIGALLILTGVLARGRKPDAQDGLRTERADS